MVKLKGPALSIAAAGSIADAVTLSSWKGRPYAKRKGAPTGLATGLQIAYRAQMKFLVSEWPGLPAAAKKSWETLARQRNLPPYNAYIEENLQRLQQDKAPSQAYPATEDTAAGLHGTYPTWEPRPRGALITMRIYTLYDAWGFNLYRGPANGFPRTVDRLRYTLMHDTRTIKLFELRNIEPATDWWIAVTFSKTGRKQSSGFGYRLVPIPNA